jgi:hypothetical protein
MNSREQGDLGEFSAMELLAEAGARIYIPLGHSPDCDFVADLDGRLLRIQAKTTRYFRNGRYVAMLCTRGGNQSWNGIAKRLDSTRCDYVFVLTADGRRWLIPSKAVEGTDHVLLGGPKYARYEVPPGKPFAKTEPEGPSTIAA